MQLLLESLTLCVCVCVCNITTLVALSIQWISLNRVYIYINNDV